jgi:hypothetical protein
MKEKKKAGAKHRALNFLFGDLHEQVKFAHGKS